jgi:hypothetical protein
MEKFVIVTDTAGFRWEWASLRDTPSHEIIHKTAFISLISMESHNNLVDQARLNGSPTHPFKGKSVQTLRP